MHPVIIVSTPKAEKKKGERKKEERKKV